MKIVNTGLPESFINALEKRDPQAIVSGERVWSNYFVTEMFGGKIPVVFRFKGENPSSETAYDVVAHWIRGRRAGKDYSLRPTVDHWEVKFFPHPENDPEQELHILPFGYEQDVKFNGDSPENFIQFRGTNKSGLIFFTPTGMKPEFEIVGVGSETLFKEAVFVQIPEGSWRKVPGAYRADVSDGDGETIALYDKRKGKERARGVALAQKIRKNLEGEDRSYEYITLRNLEEVGEVNFALTEKGLVPISDAE